MSIDPAPYFPLVTERARSFGYSEIPHPVPEWLTGDWESTDFPSINNLESFRQWLRKQFFQFMRRGDRSLSQNDKGADIVIRDTDRVVQHVSAMKKLEGAPVKPSDDHLTWPDAVDFVIAAMKWINDYVDRQRDPLVARPRWDRHKRQLTFGGQVVTAYSRVAKNQFLVLDAFEEEGWPVEVYDPIPGGSSAQRQRLHSTITALNKGRRLKLIEFGSNGRGNGFCWRECEPNS